MRRERGPRGDDFVTIKNKRTKRAVASTTHGPIFLRDVFLRHDVRRRGHQFRSYRVKTSIKTNEQVHGDRPTLKVPPFLNLKDLKM